MTDDDADQCGAETAAGTPCSHPASRDDGRCHLHTTADDVAAPGAPSDFDDEARTDVLTAARQGTSQAGCARAAGVDESTLRGWLDRHDEFARAFARARAEGEQQLLQDGLAGAVDTSFAKFLLSTSFDYTERTEVEHSGEVDTGETDVVVEFGSDE